MVKISNFIIGTIVGSLFLTLFALFLSDANDVFSPTDATYNNATLETFNKINELKENSNSIRNETSTIKQDPTVLDVIGGFFKSGYSALKTAANSFEVFLGMADVAKDELPLGDGSRLIYDTIITIVIILIFIGVLLAAILKWVI